MGWGWLEGSQSQGGRCWGRGEMVGAEQEGGGLGSAIAGLAGERQKEPLET